MEKYDGCSVGGSGSFGSIFKVLCLFIFFRLGQDRHNYSCISFNSLMPCCWHSSCVRMDFLLFLLFPPRSLALSPLNSLSNSSFSCLLPLATTSIFPYGWLDCDESDTCKSLKVLPVGPYLYSFSVRIFFAACAPSVLLRGLCYWWERYVENGRRNKKYG